MTRRLIDYRKLDHQLAALLIETYPYGYGDEDIISFKNIQGDYVEAVQIKTADTLYLVKISKSLSNFIANFEGNLEKELEPKTPEEVMRSEEMTNALYLNFEREVEPDLD
ncbi:hypothetical protein [Maribacter arcticus]|jgi:hypothetical protein|uniref:Uncharacterized protein n=1 Tax=Maribacter arcticus TaxID=561365 RepID=A0A1T5D322_9FLAO|nr:hypothetical protein [Maribacter arcticus]SKB66049.1 hypothetical protein SAMN05660866_02637 [Maribacter arcticus]|tara:strand:- start:222 stop:551 length:330 start_codon:yes stop_codon:yes gene_type:complete